MASELLVPKLIGPYFGASLFVWSATIGTTLIGLAGGYYYSGILSEKENLIKKLLLLSSVTAIYLLFLPLFSKAIMNALVKMEVLRGILISTLLFNLPLFFLFGIYSPLIIQLISRDIEDAGNVAGKVYGLSTLSGVLFMIVTGIYLVHRIGASLSMYIMSTLMFMATILLFVIHRKAIAK